MILSNSSNLFNPVLTANFPITGWVKTWLHLLQHNHNLFLLTNLCNKRTIQTLYQVWIMGQQHKRNRCNKWCNRCKWCSRCTLRWWAKMVRIKLTITKAKLASWWIATTMLIWWHLHHNLLLFKAKLFKTIWLLIIWCSHRTCKHHLRKFRKTILKTCKWLICAKAKKIFLETMVIIKTKLIIWHKLTRLQMHNKTANHGIRQS